MSKLKALLADLKISIDSDTVEITGEILKSTDEDIAKALFGLFEQTQSITEIEDTDTAREFVLNHTNMQRLILRARQLVAED